MDAYATSFAIPSEERGNTGARDFELTVKYGDAEERFGEVAIPFNDPDGLRLELIETSRVEGIHVWAGGGMPSDVAILGFHSATLSETGYDALPVC